MKNKSFDIIDNEGGVDCLFATIRDAFSNIAQQTSINKLRKKLSEEATQEVFDEYKEQYDMYNASIVRDTNQIKQLANEYELYKQRITQTIDRDEQKAIIIQAKEVKKEHDRLLQEK